MTQVIDLSHIPTDKLLRARFEKLKKRADYDAKGIEGALFSVGQSVKTKMAKVGSVVAIEGNNVSIEINGEVKKFHASTLRAA